MKVSISKKAMASLNMTPEVILCSPHTAHIRWDVIYNICASPCHAKPMHGEGSTTHKRTPSCVAIVSVSC